MPKPCQKCQTTYQITDKDRAFYNEIATTINGKKYDIPDPTLCPDCRMQQRTAFRNEMNFHKTTCDLTGKTILTTVMPGKGYKVYDSEAWHSDQWDPLDYGRDYDPNRSFFEQLGELAKAVPHKNVMNSNCENSNYCNHAVYAKDCYLTARIVYSEKIYYSYLTLNCFRCFDGYYLQKTEESYECIDCVNSQNVMYSQRLKSCQNVYFSLDLSDCKDCFGCYGLRHKQYYFFNQYVGKEKYKQLMTQMDLGSHEFIEKMRNRFYTEEVLKFGLQNVIIENSENAIGNFIYDSQNIDQGFDVNDCQDLRYAWGAQSSKDILDAYALYHAESSYNSVAVFESQKIKFSYLAYKGCYDLEYCMECFNNTKHCFGCVGLSHKTYCILNKQYSEGEFNDLRAKIIEKMSQTVSLPNGTKTREYGEFLPPSLSPYAYNETVAQEYFPLDKAEIEKQGSTYFQREVDPNQPHYDPPDNIDEVKDDILKAVLICEITGRPYNIIPQELAFYRKHKIPIPRRCPYQRHIDRINLRLPRKLWDRRCEKCEVGVKTAYAEDRPEKIFCEACYLKEVY